MRPTIREAVFELLADGKWRTAYEIAQSVAERYGFSAGAVQDRVSYIRDLRTIERKRIRRRFHYRRADVVAA